VLTLSSSSRDKNDVIRVRTLLYSLKHFFARTDLGEFWIVSPEAELANIRASLATEDLLDHSQFLSDELLCPALRYVKMSGWQKQQLLKLAMAPLISTEYYMTLDADLICIRRFDASSMRAEGRGICGAETAADYRALYKDSFAEHEVRVKQERVEWADRILGSPRRPEYCGIFYSETPVMLHTSSVLDLTKFISESFKSPWTEALAANTPWTEYPVYFQFLERFNLLSRVHVVGNRNTMLRLDQSLWQRSSCYRDPTKYEFSSWASHSSMFEDKHGFFIAVQSSLSLPPDAVRAFSES
jgi:hypothetical protein